MTKPLVIGKDGITLEVEYNGDIKLRGKVIANDKEFADKMVEIGQVYKQAFNFDYQRLSME